MINPAWQGDFVLLNHFDEFPEIAPERAAQYQFQIIHIPLRSILGSAYFHLPDDPVCHEEFLQDTQEFLRRYLAGMVRLNQERKLLAFVLGFMVPQQNPLGRLLPRYDLRNIMHFIERLNMFLAAEVARLQNAHFIDIDQISAGIGKKHCQDDMVWSFTHGTTLSDGDHDHDLGRLEPPAPMQEHYPARWVEFFQALLIEIFGLYRTIRQQDTVKLVAVDLDDTLWRGIAAEGTLGILEGWPMGLMEALLCLKKRGILLAIVSRNDEAFIRARWNEIVQGRIRLDDFAAVKINFQPKADNLREILRDLNLRPENALMIDDNPAERAAIQTGLPGVRVLGRHLYYLKRLLLWSPETQRSLITSESAGKTEMAQAQLQRESSRRQLSREEFLHTLNLNVSCSIVRDAGDWQMNRTLELFNKTNQFNTTGERYSLEKCHENFRAGHRLFVVHAEDRFTQYGLVGAAWINDNCLHHVVMSCRALGLGIEDAMLAAIASQFDRAGMPMLLGRLQPTDANAACREFYSRNGFAQTAENPLIWRRPAAGLIPPAHVVLKTAELN